MKKTRLFVALTAVILMLCLALTACGGNGTKKYTVTFDSQGGSSVTSVEVEDGKTISKPTDPTYTGYTFKGWYKEAAGTTAWNFDTDTVTENTTLYAKWEKNKYTVKFETGGGSIVADATVEHGAKVTKPTDPTRTGYEFLGWYKDAAGNTAWNFDNDTVTSADTKIYAKWEAKTVTITWNATDGSWTDGKTKTTTGKYDELITAIDPAPTYEHHHIASWTSDEAGDNAWDFATSKISSEAGLTLYAQWDIDKYNVTFDANAEGDASVTGLPAAVEVAYNSTFTSPDAPTRTGYTFDTWYKDAECENAWNFATDVVTENTTLYAGWNINYYTVTFALNDGAFADEQTGTQDVAYNGLVIRPEDPTKPAATFAGWYMDADCTIEWNFETETITEDTTIYAKWEENLFADQYFGKFVKEGGRYNDKNYWYSDVFVIEANSVSYYKQNADYTYDSYTLTKADITTTLKKEEGAFEGAITFTAGGTSYTLTANGNTFSATGVGALTKATDNIDVLISDTIGEKLTGVWSVGTTASNFYNTTFNWTDAGKNNVKLGNFVFKFEGNTVTWLQKKVADAPTVEFVKYLEGFSSGGYMAIVKVGDKFVPFSFEIDVMNASTNANRDALRFVSPSVTGGSNVLLTRDYGIDVILGTWAVNDVTLTVTKDSITLVRGGTTYQLEFISSYIKNNFNVTKGTYDAIFWCESQQDYIVLSQATSSAYKVYFFDYSDASGNLVKQADADLPPMGV